MPNDYLTRPLQDHELSKPKTFQKTLYFFYGTLKEPATLSRILERDIPASALQPAYVMGYCLEMWGQYKALVNGPTGKIVAGMAYEVESEEDAEELAVYETSAYEVAPCNIYLPSKVPGGEPKKVEGDTFRYAGDAQALREGRWDRKLWLRNMQLKEMTAPADQELREKAVQLTRSHHSG